MSRYLIPWGILAGCSLMTGCGGNETPSKVDNKPISSSQTTSQASSTPSSMGTEISSSTQSISSSSTQSISSSASSDNNLKVRSHYPAINAVNIALITIINVEFNNDILTESFTDQLITIKKADELVLGTLEQLTPTRFAFTPSKPLAPNASFNVEISPQIMSQQGYAGSLLSWRFTTTGNVGNTTQAVIDLCMDAQDISMLDSVNRARAQSRVCGDDAMPATTSIRWNCLVEEAAQIHSDDMASNNFFDHDGSDGSSTGDRLDRVGYNYRGWGENIAAGQPDVTTVMQGWLDSPGHCRNLMSPNHLEFGLGYTFDNSADYTRYWTQNFASPR